MCTDFSWCCKVSYMILDPSRSRFIRGPKSQQDKICLCYISSTFMIYFLCLYVSVRLSITLSLTFQGLLVDSWTHATMLWTAMWMKEMETKWLSSLTARSVNRWTKSPTRNCFTRFVIKTPQQGEWLWPVVK